MTDSQLLLKGSLVSDIPIWSRPFPKVFEGPFSFPVCLFRGDFKCRLQIHGATLPLANGDISRISTLKHSWDIDIELIHFKSFSVSEPKVEGFHSERILS